MSKIGKYLSRTPSTGLESFPEGADGLLPETTPVDVVIPDVVAVAPADVVVAEGIIEDYSDVVAEQAQAFVDVDDIVEESQDLIVAVEEFKSLLSIGKERGDFSQTTLAAVITGLDYVKTRLGNDPSMVVPSLENFTSDNIAEQYDLGLESIDGFINRLNNAVRSGILSVTEGLWSSSKSKARAELAKALVQKADSILEDANNTEHYTWPAEKLTVSGKGLGKSFGQAGKFPANVTQAADQDLKATNWLLTQYPKKAGEFSRKISAVMTVAGNAGKDKVEAALAPALALKLPGASVPANLLNGSSFIGNVQIQFLMEDSGGEGTIAKIKMLDQLPIMFVNTEKCEDPAELKMAKADLIKLCNTAKQFAALILKADAEWEKEVKGAATTAMEIRSKAVAGMTAQSWSEGKLLDTMGNVMLGSANHLARPFSDSIDHAKRSATAAIDLAARLLGCAEA